MIVLVIVSCFYLVGEVFHQFFLCFSKMLLPRLNFSSLELWYVGTGLIITFPVFMSKLFRIRQKVLKIVFCKVGFFICRRVLFRDRLENVTNCFLFHRYCSNNFCSVGFYQGLLYHKRLVQ